MIGRGHRMKLLEGIIEYVQGKPGVSFTTLADYTRRWKSGKIPSLSSEIAEAA